MKLPWKSSFLTDFRPYTNVLNTRDECQVLPDFIGINIYLMTFDEGGSPDRYLWKYNIGDSIFFWTQLTYMNRRFDMILLSSTDLFMSGEYNADQWLIIMRLSNLVIHTSWGIQSLWLLLFYWLSFYCLDMPSEDSQAKNIKWSQYLFGL